MSIFYQEIAEIITNGQKNTYKAINSSIINTYWLVGKHIVEEEQNGKNKAEYGKNIIGFLSEKLTHEFGKGYDKSNLSNMRKFYGAFPILDAVRKELSWTHYRFLLKVENTKAREFYINESIDNQWDTRSLERQINSFYYERILSSNQSSNQFGNQTDDLISEATQNTTKIEPKDIIKDPYILDFLHLNNNPNLLEKDLETALISKIQDFLLELGKGFSFVARQKRLSADNEHFYIDLVFYNYILKCFVLIDLKMGKLTHQDIGQMDFYVRMWEDLCKTEGDNPTIGIILCSEKNDIIVKYSVLENNKQLFASKYMLYLPTETELMAELTREKNFIKTEEKLKKSSDEEM